MHSGIIAARSGTTARWHCISTQRHSAAQVQRYYRSTTADSQVRYYRYQARYYRRIRLELNRLIRAIVLGRYRLGTVRNTEAIFPQRYLER